MTTKEEGDPRDFLSQFVLQDRVGEEYWEVLYQWIPSPLWPTAPRDDVIRVTRLAARRGSPGEVRWKFQTEAGKGFPTWLDSRMGRLPLGESQHFRPQSAKGIRRETSA